MLKFIIGFIIGGTLGVFLMCLIQINDSNKKIEYLENLRKEKQECLKE